MHLYFVNSVSYSMLCLFFFNFFIFLPWFNVVAVVSDEQRLLLNIYFFYIVVSLTSTEAACFIHSVTEEMMWAWHIRSVRVRD